MSDTEAMTPAGQNVFPPYVNARYFKTMVSVTLRGNAVALHGHPHVSPGPQVVAVFPRECWDEFIQDCYARWSAGVALGTDKPPSGR